MYDPDIIAYLFPAEGKGRDGAVVAINMPLNRSRFAPPRRRDNLLELTHETDSRSVREPTEEPDEESDYDQEPCLVLRFSNPPKSRRGLVAGKSQKADIVLPRFKGVSFYHFALTFDEHKCLIVKDLNSTVGTRVIYDGEEGQRGHGVDWSTCGPRLVQSKVPVIKIVGDLQFKLVVPNYEVTSQTYLDNVAQFLQGTAPTEDLFSDLKIISRAQTELPTPGEALTPPAHKPGRILWKKKIGEGSFAVVSYAWDVTSRVEYALKEPLPGTEGDWEREANIMKDISHDHIVALKYASFDAGPQLYFEYVPGGSLEAYPSTTAFQRRQITIQLLDGLAYLHGKKPSIIHRDIKPENVLVKHWSHDKVHVKLADFGLSGQSDYLKTFCGTVLYAAPEIFFAGLVEKEYAEKYDPLVDNWSLSVLLVNLECRQLPKHFKHYIRSGTAWAKVLVEFVSSYLIRYGPNDLLSFLLEDMLVIDPKKRQPTEKCYQKALQLFRGEIQTPFPGDGEDSCEEIGPATRRALPADLVSFLQDSGNSEATTIRPLPKSVEGSGPDLELSDSRVLEPGSASLIAGLGQDGSGFIDSLLGLIPSDITEFERSNAPPPGTPPRTSMVNSELWDIGATTGAHDSVAGWEQHEDREGMTASDSVGSELRKAINCYLVRAIREEDSPSTMAIGSPFQRKRRRPGENQGSTTGNFSSQFVDQDLEDGVGKRSKVRVAETQA